MEALAIMKITARVIKPLVQKNIDKYESRFTLAPEFGFYIELWKSIKLKGCDPKVLSRAEKAVIIETLMNETDSEWWW